MKCCTDLVSVSHWHQRWLYYLYSATNIGHILLYIARSGRYNNVAVSELVQTCAMMNNLATVTSIFLAFGSGLLKSMLSSLL